MHDTKVIPLTPQYEPVPCSKSKLLKLYRPITLYVLNKWLKEIEPQTGPIIGKMLSPKQMAIFVERFGPPRQQVNEIPTLKKAA